MKILAVTLFSFLAFFASAQSAKISNGLASVSIAANIPFELPDSFFNTNQILVKLIDEKGTIIPCKKANIIVQPKKSAQTVSQIMGNKTNVFSLTRKDIDMLSHLSSGTTIILGMEIFNKKKYPKLYTFLIRIR